MEKCSLTWRETGGQPVPVSGLGLLISINATKNVNSRLRIKRERLEAALAASGTRSEEHTSELQSRPHLVCRLLLEKKKTVTHQQRMKTEAIIHQTAHK